MNTTSAAEHTGEFEAPADHAVFYEKHYADWTVHELPLMVYVPTKGRDRDEALTLVREILDEAAFDIRVSEIRIPPPTERASRLVRDEGAHMMTNNRNHAGAPDVSQMMDSGDLTVVVGRGDEGA